MKKIIGIMGPTNAIEDDLINAYQIGKYCAENNYITLTGGLKYGIMNEALKGAKENGGLTVGIMPTDDKSEYSKYVDIPIITTMKAGRNYIETLTSDIIVACGISAGTSSEISLAIKPKKKIILIGLDENTNNFYQNLAPNQVFIAKNYMEAIKILNS
ncbi:MAG: cytochrome [Clostridia bacterium]|nr:cytochrome [Clostridia bacterium]